MLLAVLLTPCRVDLSGWAVNPSAVFPYTAPQPLPANNRFGFDDHMTQGTWTWTEHAFVQWNALRLHISLNESATRYQRAAAMSAGFASTQFRELLGQIETAYSVFTSDSRAEIFDSYRVIGIPYTLRFVSYKAKCGTPLQVKLARNLHEAFPRAETLKIIDYAAGMAQKSRCIAELLRVNHKRRSKLFLYDISSPRDHLLNFTCRQFDGFDCEFRSFDINPTPDLPRGIHLVFATEVLEHLYPEQSKHLQVQLDTSVQQGGFFYTNIREHTQEFGHVTTNLHFWRAWFRKHGFIEQKKNILFERERKM